MGLISIGTALLRGAGSLLGIGGGAAAVGGAARVAAPSLISRIGGALIGPAGQGLAGGLAGAAVGSQLFGGGGGGAVPNQLAAIQAAGGQVTPLAGGRFGATAPNGDFQVFNRNGEPVRPSRIISAGMRLPGGATIVSVRQGGQLIGVTIRRRRKRFGAEIRTVRRTVQAAQALVNLCQPKKRRA